MNAQVTPDLTVFYDGACPLCRAEIGVYRDCQGADRVAFVDVSQAPEGEVAPGLDKGTALARFHVVCRDGTVSSGARGFALLWRALPGWRRLGWLVSLPGVSSAAELAYRAFLVIRPALQRIVRRLA